MPAQGSVLAIDDEVIGVFGRGGFTKKVVVQIVARVELGGVEE